MFYALVVLCLSVSALAQKVTLGNCPNVQGQSDFDITKLDGNWTEIARYPAAFERNGRCDVVAFVPIGNDTTMLIDSHIDVLTGNLVTVNVPLTADQNDTSVVYARFPLTPHNLMCKCRFVGTDYNEYAVGYCSAQTLHSCVQYSWILKRFDISDQSVLDLAYDAVTRNNIEKEYYEKVDHTDCPK